MRYFRVKFDYDGTYMIYDFDKRCNNITCIGDRLIGFMEGDKMLCAIPSDKIVYIKGCEDKEDEVFS